MRALLAHALFLLWAGPRAAGATQKHVYTYSRGGAYPNSGYKRGNADGTPTLQACLAQCDAQADCDFVAFHPGTCSQYDLDFVAGWVLGKAHDTYEKGQVCSAGMCCHTLGLIANPDDAGDCACGTATCTAQTGMFCSRGHRFVGCFEDGDKGTLRNDARIRSLPFRAGGDSFTVTSPAECSQACGSTFPYFGLQNGGECWCGHNPGNPPLHNQLHRLDFRHDWKLTCTASHSNFDGECPDAPWQRLDDAACGAGKLGKAWTNAVFANDPDACSSLPMFVPGGRNSDVQSGWPELTASGPTNIVSGRFLKHKNGTFRVTQAVAEEMSLANSWCFFMQAMGDDPTTNLHLVGQLAPGGRKPNLMVGSSDVQNKICRLPLEAPQQSSWSAAQMAKPNYPSSATDRSAYTGPLIGAHGRVRIGADGSIEKTFVGSVQLTFEDLAFRRNLKQRSGRIIAMHGAVLRFVRCESADLNDAGRRTVDGIEYGGIMDGGVSWSFLLLTEKAQAVIVDSVFRRTNHATMIKVELGSQLTLQGVLFEGNCCLGKLGSVVSLHHEAAAFVFDSVFTSNDPNSDRSVVSATDGASELKLASSNFTWNRNRESAALRLGGGSSGYASKCLFEGNSATAGSAGAISVIGAGTTFTLTNGTTLRGNTALLNGGALSITSGNVYIRGGTTFEGNTAQNGDGGALHLSESGHAYFGKVMFLRNTVKMDFDYGSSINRSVEVATLPAAAAMESSSDADWVSGGWRATEQQCESRGQRLCTHSEVCSAQVRVNVGQSRVPLAGLQPGEFLNLSDVNAVSACSSGVITVKLDHDVVFCCHDTLPTAVSQNIALNKPASQTGCYYGCGGIDGGAKKASWGNDGMLSTYTRVSVVDAWLSTAFNPDKDTHISINNRRGWTGVHEGWWRVDLQDTVFIKTIKLRVGNTHDWRCHQRTDYRIKLGVDASQVHHSQASSAYMVPYVEDVEGWEFVVEPFRTARYIFVTGFVSQFDTFGGKSEWTDDAQRDHFYSHAPCFHELEAYMPFGRGGAIFADSGVLNFEKHRGDAHVIQNKATIGGGLFVGIRTAVINAPTYLQGNAAAIQGGGLYTESQVTVSNPIEWRHNTAPVHPDVFIASAATRLQVHCPPGQFFVRFGTTERDLSTARFEDPLAANICVKCPLGTYADEPGQFYCLACPPGQSQNRTGQITCLACKVGRFQKASGSPFCTVCPTGRYSLDIQATSCPPCGAGTFGQSCQSCPPGKFRKNNDPVLVSCKDCAPGKYQDSPGQESCLACPPGKKQRGIGRQICEDCNSGQFRADKGDDALAKDNRTDCIVCPRGWSSHAGRDACTKCDTGKYGIKPGECRSCSPGRFADVKGCTQCKACAQGLEFVNAKQPCVACDIGKYGIKPGGECRDCAKGQFQNLKGQESCNDCPVDTFGTRDASTSSAECEDCPTSTTTGGRTGVAENHGSIMFASCVCRVQTYFEVAEFRDSGNDTVVCHTCPEGSNCTEANTTLRNMEALAGYWRMHSETSTFYACVNEDDCGGGSVGEQCREGHTGVMCAVCNESYTRQGGVCQPCATDAPTNGYAGVALAGTVLPFLFFLLMVVYLGREPKSQAAKVAPARLSQKSSRHLKKARARLSAVRAIGTVQQHRTVVDYTKETVVGSVQEEVDAVVEDAMASVTGDTTGGEIEVEHGFDDLTHFLHLDDLNLDSVTALAAQFKSMGHKARILIGYLQITSAFLFSFDIPWPPLTMEFLRGLTFVNFNFMDMFGPMNPCVLHTPFLKQAAFHMAILPILVAMLAAAGCVSCARRRGKMAVGKITRKVKSVMVTLTFLLYPGIVTKVFTTFKCQPVGESRFLVADYGVVCGEGDHSIAVRFMIVFMFVYVIGIPLASFLWLRRNKHFMYVAIDADAELKEQSEHFEEIYGALYEAYDEKFWWFETLIMGHKALLTGGLVIVAPGTSAQILVGLIVALMFTFVLLWNKPYKGDDEDRLQTVAAVSTVFTLLIGFTLKIDRSAAVTGAGEYDNRIMDVMLVFLFFSVGVGGLWMTLQSLPTCQKVQLCGSKKKKKKRKKRKKRKKTAKKETKKDASGGEKKKKMNENVRVPSRKAPAPPSGVAPVLGTSSQ